MSSGSNRSFGTGSCDEDKNDRPNLGFVEVRGKQPEYERHGEHEDRESNNRPDGVVVVLDAFEVLIHGLGRGYRKVRPCGEGRRSGTGENELYL